MLKNAAIAIVFFMVICVEARADLITVQDYCDEYSSVSRGQCLENCRDYLDEEGYGSTVVNGVDLYSSKYWIKNNATHSPTIVQVESDLYEGSSGAGGSD